MTLKLNRRAFLKLGGSALVAAVAAPAVERILHASAPLYIPAERLDMGVPHALKPTLLDVQQLARLYNDRLITRPDYFQNADLQAGLQRQGYSLADVREKMTKAWEEGYPRYMTKDVATVRDEHGTTFETLIDRGWEDDIKAMGERIHIPHVASLRPYWGELSERVLREEYVRAQQLLAKAPFDRTLPA